MVKLVCMFACVAYADCEWDNSQSCGWILTEFSSLGNFWSDLDSNFDARNALLQISGSWMDRFWDTEEMIHSWE